MFDGEYVRGRLRAYFFPSLTGAMRRVVQGLLTSRQQHEDTVRYFRHVVSSHVKNIFPRSFLLCTRPRAARDRDRCLARALQLPAQFIDVQMTKNVLSSF